MEPHLTPTREIAADPLHHARRMSARLTETIADLRADIDAVDEPQFRAMFETAAEVMCGLVTAFRHYEQHNEPAWNDETDWDEAARRSR
jgi:hypothetical protein